MSRIKITNTVERRLSESSNIGTAARRVGKIFAKDVICSYYQKQKRIEQVFDNFFQTWQYLLIQ